MNLIKALAPFNKDLDNWKKGLGFSNREKLEKLTVIWFDFSSERKEEIYGSRNHKVLKVDLGCGSCVKDMISFLFNWRAIERRNPDNGVPHKMVPPKKSKVKTVPPIKTKVDIKIDGKTVPDTKEEITGTVKIEIDEKAVAKDVKQKWHDKIDLLDWAGLKSLAGEKGISIYKKKKVDLIKELKKAK